MLRNENSKSILVSLGILLVLGGSPLWGLDRSGSVSGIVKTSSGAPAVGAMVKVRNADFGVTVSVISREDGRYTVPDLPVGTYTIRAVGGGFQTETEATVEVSASGTAPISLALSHRQNLKEAMTSSQLTQLMPEGEGKEKIVSECALCHTDGLYKILSRRMNRDGWNDVIGKMEVDFYNYAHGLTINDRDREAVLDYLTKYLGPDAPPVDPALALASTWVTGAAAKSVVTEFDLPHGSNPHDVAVDSQGIGWVTESSHGVIGRLDPQTLSYTRIPVPDWQPIVSGDDDAVHAITFDAQGQLWFSMDYRTARVGPAKIEVVRYDPKTGNFAVYPYPTPNLPGKVHPNTIRIDRNGMVWLTEHGSDQIFKLDPSTRKFTQFSIPSAVRTKTKAFPYGAAIDGDGWIWFAEYEGNMMGRIDAKTGEISEYNVPTPRSYPKRMDTDAEGNVWFAEFAMGGKLAMVDRRTAKITEYPTPVKHSGTYSVTVDKKRNLIWVNELLADKLARFDPRTKTFVEYPMPTSFSSVRRIEADPSRSNRVWYAGFNSDKIGYLDVLE